MPSVSADVWNILYTVSRYLFPVLAAIPVFLVLLYTLSEARDRKNQVRNLPGSGTVGELIVLSGGRDLDLNTWFPVPREGNLGSVRSCDLVVPCPGVHARHLDFSWRDGKGLLIYPRSGCEVVIDGRPVTCRSGVSDLPLRHGSVLQVGSAVLRLHLFAALDNTPAASADPVYPAQYQPVPYYPDSAIPVPPAGVVPPAGPVPFEETAPSAVSAASAAPAAAEESTGAGSVSSEGAAPPAGTESPVSGGTRRRSGRSGTDRDRWKEDFGE